MRRLMCVLAAALLAPAHATAAPRVEDRVTLLVQFVDGTSEAESAALATAAGARVTGYIPEVSVARVTVPTAVADTYAASPLVRAVQRDRKLELFGSSRPNDPLVHLQWSLKQMDAFDAWRIETGKKAAVKVAVIDTGVDASHADLEGRVTAGYDFLELDDDAYDDHGHGTHVAGIIAANMSNREGITGVSAGAEIVPMKSCTSGGACPLFPLYLSAVDAVRRGAAVLNMSLGGEAECGPIDQAVFDWIREQGSLAVVAAGNSGSHGNPSIMPANCDNTFAVGAVNKKGKKTGFSSYGDFVDIAAPGAEVWSTLPPLISIFSPHLGYGPAWGTSMAAPHVAGAAALLKAKHPEWSPDQIEAKLTSSAVDAGEKGRDDLYGAGLLNLHESLR